MLARGARRGLPAVRVGPLRRAQRLLRVRVLVAFLREVVLQALAPAPRLAEGRLVLAERLAAEHRAHDGHDDGHGNSSCGKADGRLALDQLEFERGLWRGAPGGRFRGLRVVAAREVLVRGAGAAVAGVQAKRHAARVQATVRDCRGRVAWRGRRPGGRRGRRLRRVRVVAARHVRRAVQEWAAQARGVPEHLDTARVSAAVCGHGRACTGRRRGASARFLARARAWAPAGRDARRRRRTRTRRRGR